MSSYYKTVVKNDPEKYEKIKQNSMIYYYDVVKNDETKKQRLRESASMYYFEHKDYAKTMSLARYYKNKGDMERYNELVEKAKRIKCETSEN